MEFIVDPAAELALMRNESAVHIGYRRSWQSSVGRGERVRVGLMEAKALSVSYHASWESVPAPLRARFTGDPPDPTTASCYGLYAVVLVRT
jgi:hypothetical protein